MVDILQATLNQVQRKETPSQWHAVEKHQVSLLCSIPPSFRGCEHWDKELLTFLRVLKVISPVHPFANVHKTQLFWKYIHK